MVALHGFSGTNQCSDTGPSVYCLYLRRLESLTILRCQSQILRVFFFPGCSIAIVTYSIVVDVIRQITSSSFESLIKYCHVATHFFQVKLAVLLSYLKSNGVCLSIFTVSCLVVMEACAVGTGIWLAYWSSANVTTNEQRDFYIGIYGGIGLGQAFLQFLVCLCVTLGAVIASRRLHSGLLVNVMHSPMSFFDTTPLGRIVNRFSKDIYTIDETIPRALMDFLWCFMDVLGMIVAISYATPLFLAVLPVLGVLYIYIQVRAFVAQFWR